MSRKIEINGNPKLSKIIVDLSYGSESQAVKLMQLVNTDEFRKYCRTDSVAKTDAFEDIPERVLHRLVRDFRTAKVFSVDNVSDNNYNFKDNKTKQDALQLVADFCYVVYHKHKNTMEDKQELVKKVRTTARNRFRKELVNRLNRYGANFDAKTTPLADLYAYAYDPANNVSDIDKNFSDLVQTAYSDLNFWKEAFHNSKVANLGMESNDNKQDIDRNMIPDEKVCVILNALPKLASTYTRTAINPVTEEKTFIYDYDRSNSLGVIKYHTYRECAIEIAGFIGKSAWESVNIFIYAIESLAKIRPYFAGLKKLADDMRSKDDTAEIVYKDLSKYKYNINVLITYFDEYGNLVSSQVNNGNDINRLIYLGLRNDFKYSSINLNNADIEVELKDIKNKLDKAKISTNIINQSKGVGVRRTNGKIVKTNVDVNPQTDSIRSILKLYFPNFDTGSYDRYIISSENKIATLMHIVEILDKVNSVARVCAKEYYKIRNKALIKAALNESRDISSVQHLEIDYLRKSNVILACIARIFAPYSKLDHRNVDDNLQSRLY